jgi:serine protease inhibitor
VSKIKLLLVVLVLLSIGCVEDVIVEEVVPVLPEVPLQPDFEEIEVIKERSIPTPIILNIEQDVINQLEEVLLE